MSQPNMPIGGPTRQHSSTYEKNNVINIKGIREQNLPYLIAWLVFCAWVIVFAVWWTESPLINPVFKTEIRNLTHFVFLISSAVFIFLIRKEWHLIFSRIGAISIILSMGTFLMAKNAYVQKLSAIVIAIALGSVNIGIFIPYVFTLNNTEKIFAVVGSHILINLLLFLQLSGVTINLAHQWVLIISFAILILALSFILFFKKDSISLESKLNSEEPVEIPFRIYLTAFFNFFVIVLTKGVGHGIFHITMELTGMPVLIWYIAGSVFGCIAYILIYAVSKRAFIWLANITFASVTMAILCNALVMQIPIMALIFAFLLGLGSTVGMINVYYIMGIIGKKYNSIRYLRFSYLYIVVLGGIAGLLIGNHITHVNTLKISNLFSLIATLVMLSFLIVSPLFASSEIEDDWAKDSHSMDIDNDPYSMFRKYNLSKRELEVCKLLLDGYTMRQISAMLSISYSTVNTYCTSSYRKLEINSRTELLLLFKDYVLKQ